MKSFFGLLMILMIASSCFAALSENNTITPKNEKSQKQIMHDFMQTLTKSAAKEGIKTLDEATNKASEGKFQTLDIAVQNFINDYNKTIKRDSNGQITDNSANEFLLKYCGIDLSNSDVGAITGKDAGESLIELSAESIIPENIDNIIYLDRLWNESPVSLNKINELDDVFAFRTPLSTLKFKKRGLNIIVANYEILDKKDKIIVNGLYNWWIEGALDLIEKSYGITFSDNELNQIMYIDSFKIFSSMLKIVLDENTLAAAKKTGNYLSLWINKRYFDDDFEIKLNPSGKFRHQFFDRTIAHEFTHEIMAAKIKNYDDFPLFVKEGLAELTVGADDTRALIKLLKSPERLSNSFYHQNKSIDDDVYCAGYIFFRYFAKQVSYSKNAENNQTMIFSQPTKIGEVTLPPMGFFDIKESADNQGKFCTDSAYKHLKLYEKGIARFGNGIDALYFHYDSNKRVSTPSSKYPEIFSKFGSQDIKNTVQDLPGIPTFIWLIKTNSEMTFYMIEHGDAAGFGSSCTLIGKNKEGKFVKYLNTYEIKDRYFGEKNHRGIGDEWNKFSFQDNTIIIRYGKYGSYNKFNAIGEFRFTWDDRAQWFNIEHVVY